MNAKMLKQNFLKVWGYFFFGKNIYLFSKDT